MEMPHAPAHKVLPVWRATAERQRVARSNCLVNARQHLLAPLMRDRKPALLHRGRDSAQALTRPSASGALRAAPCTRFRAAQAIRRLKCPS